MSAKPGAEIDVVEFASFDQGVDRGGALAAPLAHLEEGPKMSDSLALGGRPCQFSQ